MKKIFFQVALALLLTLALGAGVFYKAALPNILQASSLNLVYDVQTAVANLQADYGEIPAETPALIAKLKGDNAEGKDYLPGVIGDLIGAGGITDSYGQLIRFEPNDPVPIVVSAGPDQEFGTSDDMNAGTLRNIIGRYGGLGDANDGPRSTNRKKAEDREKARNLEKAKNQESSQ